MKRLFLHVLAFLLIFLWGYGISQANLNDGLVAYYPFNGNDLANDIIGGNNGIVNGATLTSDRFGNPNSAYSLTE